MSVRISFSQSFVIVLQIQYVVYLYRRRTPPFFTLDSLWSILNGAWSHCQTANCLRKTPVLIVVTFLFATISNFKRHEIIADQSFQHGAEMNGVEEIVWLQMYRVVYKNQCILILIYCGGKAWPHIENVRAKGSTITCTQLQNVLLYW